MGFVCICKLRLVLPIDTTFHTQEGGLRIAIERKNFSPIYVTVIPQTSSSYLRKQKPIVSVVFVFLCFGLFNQLATLWKD